jgi:LysR family transcriptional regulator, glycine cleavage system transcriptional activator
VRLGGLQEASVELALSVSALSHQLRGLERAFPQPLLEKRGRRLVTTAAGRALYSGFGSAFHEIDTAVERARSNRPTLTISSHAAFAARWLLPRMNRFLKLMPEIELTIHTSSRVEPLTPGRIDCAIRLGAGPWKDAISILLMQQTEAPMMASTVRKSAKLPRILLEGREDEWRHWPKLSGGPITRTVASRELVVEAVLSGLGMGIVDTAIVESELEHGYIRALAPPRATGWAYHLVRPAAANDPHVARFTRWLLREIRAEASR